jgi:hypothetical protein
MEQSSPTDLSENPEVAGWPHAVKGLDLDKGRDPHTADE